MTDLASWLIGGGALFIGGAVGAYMMHKRADASAAAAAAQNAAPAAPAPAAAATVAAPVDGSELRAARAEAEELRERLGQTEAALRASAAATIERPVSEDSEKLRAAIDDAASLRDRLAQAEAALRGMRRAGPPAPAAPADPAAPNPSSTDALRAMADDAHSLRRRLSQAEAALRNVRHGVEEANEVKALKAEIAALNAGAPKSSILIDERRAFASEIDSMRKRAAMAETALRRMRVAHR